MHDLAGHSILWDISIKLSKRGIIKKGNTHTEVVIVIQIGLHMLLIIQVRLKEMHICSIVLKEAWDQETLCKILRE